MSDAHVAEESLDLVRQLSALQAPTVLRRDQASVNLSAAYGHKATGGFASFLPSMGRVSSIPAQRPEGSTGLHWTESRKILEAAIAIEQQTAPAHPDLAWRQDLAAQEQRLMGRLATLGLDMEVQRGDGNCQFRSMSRALYGTPEHHARVRRRVVDHMRLRRSDFEAFLGQDFKAYVQEMAKDGVWGDELTLRAACEAFGVVVNVVSSDADNWFHRYIPAHALVRHEAFLSYIAPVHYNAISRQPRRAAARALRTRSSLGRRDSRILAALDDFATRREVPETPQAVIEEAAAYQ